MKLIAEYTENDLHCSINEAKDGTKKYTIEGVFMQSEQVNRNGRIYEAAGLKSAVDKYIKEQVDTGRAVGELNHPDGPSINLDKVSHRITELRFEGNDVYGKAQILDTPMGNIVKGLLEGGVKLGVSSRGMGSLVKRNGKTYVGDDFHLTTVDIVQDPSAPNAFVNGIMEGVDFFYEGSQLKSVNIEEAKAKAEADKKELAESQLNSFQKFLSGL
jgi:hypothetical protein